MFKETIQHENDRGERLTASFATDKGMNLLSYKRGDLEIIDQSTLPLFQERYAGLGAMIGPHFHHRKEGIIPPVRNESLFPHIARLKAKGVKEPFSHGIGRYAPWKIIERGADRIKAILRGDDLWNDIPLKELEGQNFVMTYIAHLFSKGLEITLSVNSDTGSLVGLHTYYALANREGIIQCRVKDYYLDKSEKKAIPSTWNYSEDHTLIYPLNQETDYGFHPYPDPLHGKIKLETKTHAVVVEYHSENEENSFQVWHQAGGSFVCIEPLSAKDPRKPKLSVSQLKILISIL